MASWPALVLFVSQILLDTSLGLPLFSHDSSNISETTRPKRSSATPICPPKTRLTQPSGVITSPRLTRLPEESVSCSWLIHASRGNRVKLEFQDFNVIDECPGACKCNYVVIKEPKGNRRSVPGKYCNNRKPPRVFVSTGQRVKIHLRLKPGSMFQINRFTVRYTTMSGGGKILPGKVKNMTSKLRSSDLARFVKTPVGKETFHSEVHSGYASGQRLRKGLPTTNDFISSPTTPTSTGDSTAEDEETGPSKLTILLAIAIPVVMIFIIVVLVIAYYNHMVEQKQQKAREDVPNNGSALGDLLLRSSFTLTPMFNLKKAKKESSKRREQANQLYDDMLQNWRAMNANRKERLKAKQESVNVWESYQASRKQRLRSAKDSEVEDSKAFAMLVSNAINVATNTAVPEINEPFKEEVEEQPRPSSILMNRHFPDEIRQKRGSKVLSWSDLSTKSKEDTESNVAEKRAASETELKVRKSGHIPAIVVSQPSFETEDDETEATDTDRLLKDEKDGGAKTSGSTTNQAKNTQAKQSEPNKSKPTYSCSEHVKDILRESYGDEVEEWWQKPKKSESQGSLKHSSDSDVKYKAMKDEEEDEID